MSYRQKHNLANGEGNRDGENHNHSDNYGVEGPTDDPDVETSRRRQIRNLVATLLLSQGVPMLVAGDEFRRTQRGNNNAWCQDNELSWLDWRMAETHADLVRFCREMIRFRRQQPTVRRRHFLTGTINGRSPLPDVSWFDPTGRVIPWDQPDSTIVCLLSAPAASEDPELFGRDVLVLFNAGKQPVRFTAPSFLVAAQWRLLADTAAEPPDDIFPEASGPSLPADRQVLVASRALKAYLRP